MTDRTYIEIDIKAIRHNIGIARERVGKDVRIMCLVKADAYGHGAAEVAQHCSDLIDYLGVATVDEGIQLRKNGINLPILIVGNTAKSRYADAIDYDLHLTVHSIESAQSLYEFCLLHSKVAKVHIAVDTGMGRIGFLAGEIDEAIKICKSKHFEIKGIFTHFAKADEINKEYSHMQIAVFDEFVNKMKRVGIDVGLRHVANSASILSMPCCNYDMVRMGIMTYGLNPSACVNCNDLVPAMSLRSHIVQIKTLPKGSAVSYGGEYVTMTNTVVATVAVGYGDGYPRTLSGKGCHMLVDGQRAPILGKICMDQTMIDVTNINDVNVGDIVTLIGSDGRETITADEIASLAGTVNYEIVCGISQRVSRKYTW